MSSSYYRLHKQLVEAVKLNVTFGYAKPPEAGRLLWDLFCQLTANRSVGLTGFNPLSWGELQAWLQVSGWPLEQRHIATLMAMDEAFITAIQSRKSDRPVLKASPDAMDAVFKAAGW